MTSRCEPSHGAKRYLDAKRALGFVLISGFGQSHRSVVWQVWLRSGYDSFMIYKREKRPVLDIPWTLTDRLVMTVGMVSLVVVVALPVFAWSGLPDRVPIHFGVSGEPDRWANRNMVWFLPVIGLITCFPMAVLTRYPHIYNYPWTITEENAPALYHLSRSMLIWLSAECALLFVYIEWAMLRTSTGEMDGMDVLAMPLILLVIFGTMGYFMYASWRTATPASGRSS